MANSGITEGCLALGADVKHLFFFPLKKWAFVPGLGKMKFMKLYSLVLMKT